MSNNNLMEAIINACQYIEKHRESVSEVSPAPGMRQLNYNKENLRSALDTATKFIEHYNHSLEVKTSTSDLFNLFNYDKGKGDRSR